MATVTQTIVIQCGDAAEFAAFSAHVTQQQQQEADLAGASRVDDESSLKITVVNTSNEAAP